MSFSANNVFAYPYYAVIMLIYITMDNLDNAYILYV